MKGWSRLLSASVFYLVAAVAQAEWSTVEAGAGTICSDGSDYRFFVREADPEKLLIYFQGGGACWFPENCDVHLAPSYKVRVDANEPERYRGIFEFDNPENPFRDYSVVMAPYCTADVHMGDREMVYETPEGETSDGEAHPAHPLTIHHRGFANAEAVLNWTYANFEGPETVFVTGSSAGSIPSPYYAWQVAEHYREAAVAQLGDAAGGYRRSAETSTLRMDRWGTLDYLGAKHEPFNGLAEAAFTYELLYIEAARARPDIQFAAYDAAEDAVQKRFLALGGSETTTLLELLLLNQADIRREVDNFRSYIGPGDSHTILARPEFYNTSVNGVRFRDWVAELAAMRPVDDVRCDPCTTADHE